MIIYLPDPHNNGTYSVLADNTATGGDLEMQRVTGSGCVRFSILLSFCRNATESLTKRSGSL